MTAKKRKDHSVLEVGGGFVAIIVGAVLTLMPGGDVSFLIGAVLFVAGIVLVILGFVQYGRNVRAVSSAVMGAVAKVNQPPTKSE